MLPELLGGMKLGEVGYAGIVILVVLMVLTDRLVTRKRLEESREDGKAWRSSAETQQAINGELKAAVLEILPYARATHHALTSIQSTLGLGATSIQEEQP